MGYQPNSTFVTFPNGETLDVAGCGMTVSDTTLIVTRAGQTLYSYKFSSPSDVRKMISIISQAMSAFITNPLFSYSWSTDAMTWFPGPVPITSQPIYLQVGSESVSNLALAMIEDHGGREFQNLALDVVSPNAVVIGPFNQPGSNTPAVGSATLFVMDAGGAIVGSLMISFAAQGSSSPTVTLVQWSTDDIDYVDQPVNISPGSPFSFQINGTNLPTTGQYIVIGGGPAFGLSSSSSTRLTTGNFAANLSAGTYDCQVFDAGNNLLADLGNIIIIIQS